MFVHPKWVPKYRTHFKPQFYDTIHRRWDSKTKDVPRNYRTQDPLWFDHQQEHLNGGISLIIDHLHDSANYTLPIRNQAFLIYNMFQKKIYDPMIYEKFESQLRMANKNQITARHAYGALVAYYSSN